MNKTSAKEGMPLASLDPLLQQALSHHQAGRLAEAVGLYCQVLDAYPDHVDALNFGGAAFFQSGENDQALEMLRKAVKLAPDYAEVHNNLGKVLHESGSPGESLLCFERALELKPDFLEAGNNLGLALQALGRLGEAVETYRSILSHKPDIPEILVNLSRVLLDMKEYDEAEVTIKRTIKIWPHAVAYDNLAVIHMATDRYDLAAEACRQAIAKDPSYAEAHNNLGVCLIRMGQDEEAARAHRRALELAPHDIKLHYNYAQGHIFSTDDPELEVLEKLLQHEGLPDYQRGLLLFALGKAHDEVENYNKAFSFYERGNALMAEGVTFDRERHHDLIASIKKAFAKCAISDIAGKTELGPVPVFIVGLSRSGTSLAGSLLSQHDLVHGVGESAQWVLSLEEILKKFEIPEELPDAVCLLDKAQKKKVAEVFIEKISGTDSHDRYIVNTAPENYFYVGMILESLPQAKIIHCRWDTVDTALSIFFSRYERGHAYSYDIGDIASYMADYLDLMAYWENGYGDRVLSLHYEDLTEPTQGTCDRIYRFCGLKGGELLPNDLLTKEYTGRWEKYEPHLGPMLEAFRDHGLIAENSQDS